MRFRNAAPVLPLISLSFGWLVATVPSGPSVTSSTTTAAVKTNWSEAAPSLRSAPLPHRIARDNATLFESLSHQQTGVDFAVHWEPSSEYEFKIYNSLPGGGVCVGDIDGDSLPDVLLTQPDVGVELYKNLGDFHFENITTAAGIGKHLHAHGPALVDIDNDSDLDLFLSNNGHPNVLYVNNGDGTFHDGTVAAGLEFNGVSVMIAFADYDADGDLDGYLVTYRKEPEKGQAIAQPKQLEDGSYEIPEASREYIDVIVGVNGKPRVVRAGQADKLYRNNGDGTFSEVSEAAGISGYHWGLSAVWWDYDNNGTQDLYVSNDFYSPDLLYHNNGDGTFSEVSRDSFSHTPWYSMGADAADINNDGFIDFLASDMSGTDHYKQKLSMGDMGATGWFLVHPEPRQYMRNALFLNTGTGHFVDIAQMAGVSNTDWTWSPKFGDLDEDGWIDLYVTNGMSRDWNNSDVRSLADSAATDEEKMQIWINSPPKNDLNLAFKNTGKLKFDAIGETWGLSEKKVSYGAALADFDRDGDLDAIVNNAEEAPGIYRNGSHASHRAVFHLKGTKSNRRGIGAVVTATTDAGTQTRHLTSTQGFMAANEPIVHFGFGESESITMLSVRWPSGIVQQFENLPADHLYEITEAITKAQTPDADALPLLSSTNTFADITHREIPFNEFVRQPLLPNQLSQLGPGMAVGDIDADGDEDLVLGGASGQPTRILKNIDGKFVSTKSIVLAADTDCEDMGLLLFDADADGDLDLFAVSGGVEADQGDAVLNDRLYLNDGTGTFTKKAPLPETGTSGSVVCAADFDRDGDLDLFVGGRVIPGSYPLSPVSRILKNEGDNFVEATAESAPELAQTGLVTSAIWSDVDSDGWIDLLVTHEWGPVKIFRNEGGKLSNQTASSGIAELTGWFNSIVAGDFDSDGDMDYAVGNHGRNSKYHASSEKPSLLYYGDFEQSGRMRLVEAEFEDETLFPARGKSCSTNAMPFLGEKFTKFHDFAIASLEEIYTPAKLESSHRFAATTLDSGILQNDGTGKFTFTPLPWLAQASATFGMIAVDANGDGNLDLLLAQNFFAPQPETGRVDGSIGLLLTGSGNGTFEPVLANGSGIVVPGDATSTVLLHDQNDTTPLVVVATNDGPVHSFRLPPGSGRSIRLLSNDGVSPAIGARVIGARANNRRFILELAAGGGYLSQSSSVVRLPAETDPTSIEVSWPSGTRSTHSLSPVDEGNVTRLVQPD